MTSAMLAMILAPLVMAVLLLTWLHPVVIRALGLAPMPALLLFPAAWSDGARFVTLPGGWTLVLDQPGALMLVASTLLWITGGLAASRWLVTCSRPRRFALWWLLTLCGSLGVFVAGDVAGFYALYALASLPAYGLIAFGGGAADRQAARITLAAALVGEGLILLAFVLMAASVPGQGLAIAEIMEALPLSPHCGLMMALVVVGFGLKIGLVPLHGWMPVSYAAGPLVATAVLSGATSKAGIIGLIRFLPLDAAMPPAGGLILAAGLFSAFFGAVLGLTQSNPRSVLAYSSISQLGQMTAALGAGVAAGMPGAGAAVACYAVYHVLAKGGLFLMLGARREGGELADWKFLVAGAAALGFAGLPLTGGALGKLAVKEITGSDATGLLFSLAAVGSTVLVLHFLRLLRKARGDVYSPVVGVSALVAATLLQWLLFAAVTGVSPAYSLSPGVLFDLSWPIAAGALLSWVLFASGVQVLGLPPGDIGAAAIAALERLCRRFMTVIMHVERQARRWEVSALLAAAAVLLFVLALRPA